MSKNINRLLILMLIFSMLATPAFAAKPVKVASFTIEETYLYDNDLGEGQIVSLFTVKDNQGDPYVVSVDEGSAYITSVKIKNKIKYQLWYNAEGSLLEPVDIIMGVNNSAGVVSFITVTIDILQPVSDKPPVNLVEPSINGIFETGQSLIANFGEWTDEGVIELIAVWRLSNGLELNATEDDKLLLLDEWANMSIQLSVKATDSINQSTTLETEPVIIKDVSVPDELVYVALGDSIPYGSYYTSLWNYLFGGTDTFSYVEQLSNSINSTSFYDESASGYNSDDILEQINELSSVISEADVITLCVGANDIMDAASRSISGLDKYDIDWDMANSGRDSFEANWPQIVDSIENMNPDVTLVVMTIYNPYHTDDPYYNLVNPYFSSTDENHYGLNYIINHTEELYGHLLDESFDYRLVDVYEGFNNHPDMDSLTGFYDEFCDPHPNQAGQNLIYDLHMVEMSDIVH